MIASGSGFTTAAQRRGLGRAVDHVEWSDIGGTFAHSAQAADEAVIHAIPGGVFAATVFTIGFHGYDTLSVKLNLISDEEEPQHHNLNWQFAPILIVQCL